MQPEFEQQQVSLFGLNMQQQQAVSAPTNGTVIVRGGPGTGKTHVLVYRIAYLITQKQFNPQNIVVVTFTKKAATEMKELLAQIIPRQDAEYVRIGTFYHHAETILRNCPNQTPNYSIIDRNEQEGIITGIFTQLQVEKKKEGNDLVKNALKLISRAKNEEKTVADMKKEAQSCGQQARGILSISESPQQLFARIYEQYETYKEGQNMMDFDDLLFKVVKLLKSNPQMCTTISQYCEALCVDEFQDISSLKYNLCKLFTTIHQHLFIVGDQDQSICSWAFADPANWQRLLNRPQPLIQIQLNKSYRSSENILQCADVIINEAENRTKILSYPVKPVGPPVCIVAARNKEAEGKMIADDIKYLLGTTNQIIKCNDIAVLARTKDMCDVIETAFFKAGIKSKTLANCSLFQRNEIKDLLAYLQLAENRYTCNTEAFERVINVPKRNVSEQLIQQLKEARMVNGRTIMAIAERACRDDVNQGLKDFVKIIDDLEKMNKRDCTPADVLKQVIKSTNYKKYLEQHYETTFSTRWEKVQEFLTYCEKFPARYTNDPQTCLFAMLQEIALYEKQDSVTISTIHAAKGQEFGVVFIPSMEEKIVLNNRCQTIAEIEEQRRLLFVGMTRAKALLCLSYTTTTLQQMIPNDLGHLAFVDSFHSIPQPVPFTYKRLSEIPLDLKKLPELMGATNPAVSQASHMDVEVDGCMQDQEE